MFLRGIAVPWAFVSESRGSSRQRCFSGGSAEGAPAPGLLSATAPGPAGVPRYKSKPHVACLSLWGGQCQVQCGLNLYIQTCSDSWTCSWRFLVTTSSAVLWPSAPDAWGRVWSSFSTDSLSSSCNLAKVVGVGRLFYSRYLNILNRVFEGKVGRFGLAAAGEGKKYTQIHYFFSVDYVTLLVRYKSINEWRSIWQEHPLHKRGLIILYWWFFSILENLLLICQGFLFYLSFSLTTTSIFSFTSDICPCEQKNDLANKLYTLVENQYNVGVFSVVGVSDLLGKSLHLPGISSAGRSYHSYVDHTLL